MVNVNELYDKGEDMANIADNQGGLGKLRFISNTKKPCNCRECKVLIPSYSKCFSQSDYRQDGNFFPTQTRLCISCGQEQIEAGVDIKNLDLMNKIIKKQKIKELNNGLVQVVDKQ